MEPQDDGRLFYLSKEQSLRSPLAEIENLDDDNTPWHRGFLSTCTG
jgi:hypothetical protein